jgi:hypothetical protein
MDDPLRSLAGIAAILTGLPAYWFFARHRALGSTR